MSNLITFENVSLAYGLEPLLDKVNFQISKNERVCLIGRNGAGKSSLLKLVEGFILPDTGTVWRKPGLRIARLAQDLPDDTNLTVYDFVSQGLAQAGELLRAYHEITHQLATNCTDESLQKLERIQREIDSIDGWRMDQQITQILTRLSLDPDQLITSLSGGWQRRAALARALVVEPELLLLDEPTNHLDIEAIKWLEDELLATNVAVLFITHDRALLQRLATRIIELDRGQLTSWPGDYQAFLQHKSELLHAEAKQFSDFDKKLAQEEQWIRQGIKARRTRNEGRVRALEAMRAERAKRREVQGRASFNLNEATKSGALVVEAEDISYAFADKKIVENLSTRIMRGDRIGFVGANGIGKSTLLNILLGKLIPQTGKITLGTRLETAYFDQRRDALDLEKTVIENVGEGSDTIEINGERRHLIGYLSEFLFSPERARTPVKALSGGERNRLLLARLFSKPANLIVMDEPTNDLDIETLELLEELLLQFKGTLLIVSHDRAFLDNVVTSVFVFYGNGKIIEHVGGYQEAVIKPVESPAKAQPKVVHTSDQSAVTAKKKLSFKEQRELEELPNKIEKLESSIKSMQEEIASPDFYKANQELITQKLDVLSKAEAELTHFYERWERLSE